MEIESIHKYIALNKLANGSTEVLFSGQPCLTVTESFGGNVWKINPVFAKLVYGANVFEDIPTCSESFASSEEAIAGGLVKLHELGAFNTEYDFPEDTYAATMNTIVEDVKKKSLNESKNLMDAHKKFTAMMLSFGITEQYSEFCANMSMAQPTSKEPIDKKKIWLKSATGSRISQHDTHADALRAWKSMASNNGVKIMSEDVDMTEVILSEDIVDDKYAAWEDSVKKAHPEKALKFKSRFETGGKMHTTSAEVSGKDRSFGVWDHSDNTGKVFEAEEKEPEEKEEKEIVAALKKDKKFISKVRDI